MAPRSARLRNWQTGLSQSFHPQSDLIQWILDAQWYNWSWEDRFEITRDVEASNVIWVTPSRLGVVLRYACLVDGDKRHACIFIALYDGRVITPDLFRIQTYSEWFREFARNIEEGLL